MKIPKLSTRYFVVGSAAVLALTCLILLSRESDEVSQPPVTPTEDVTTEIEETIEATVETLGDQIAYLSGLESVSVEIADELYYTNDILKAWTDANKENPGLYTKEIEGYTYLLATSGLKPTTGYGMGFIDCRRDNIGLVLVYTVIEPMTSEDIQTEESYPFMLLRLPQTNEEIRGIFVKEYEISSYFDGLLAPQTEQVLEPEVETDMALESEDELTTESETTL